MLIVAEDVESDALATIILNKLRLGIKVLSYFGFSKRFMSVLWGSSTFFSIYLMTNLAYGSFKGLCY